MTKLTRTTLLLVFLLAACNVSVDPPATLDMTALPDPTPTQEVVTDWSVACLPSGVVPINERPCPVTSLAPGEFVSRANGNYGDSNAALSCDGQCRIELYGFAGFTGVQLHGLELVAGQTYMINLDGYLDLRDGGARHNYAGQARVYFDSRTVTLRDRGVEAYVNGAWTYSGQRNFFWCVQPRNDVTVVLEVGLGLVWATAHAGNYYAIDGVYMYPVDNVNLCDEVIGL